ncbi:MAG: type VI secretion system tip protein VgrG [Chloracidobacterium sp.]|nr:type VI secretion system tip protein VgrG [Chloracidobacterium sp.]
MATTQDGRTLQLSTVLGKDVLLVSRFRCVEGISQLFKIELDLLHEETDEGYLPTVYDAAGILGYPMALAVLQAGGVERKFHGMCNHFTQLGRSQRFSQYKAELVPAIWKLTQITQSRIFQQKSVPDILTEILDGFEFTLELQEEYKPRNYCVQYRETDWAFASRLMEEVGIFYFFEHTDSNHKLILADKDTSHRPCPSLPDVTWALERSEIQEHWIPSIYTWQLEGALRTGKQEVRDFNFQLPSNSLEHTQTSRFTAGGNQKLEHYDWPAGYAKRYDGIAPGGGEQPNKLDSIFPDRERDSTLRQEEIDARFKVYMGGGNCAPLTSGFRFNFKDHPIRDYNTSYVLTHVQHDAVQSPEYISDSQVDEPYSAEFSCIRHGAGQPTFRPPRITPKPIVHGGQTAFVVGPGEEIFTDKYGRVKVQFHWDRENFLSEKSSCWLRVAQAWAGNLWGSMFIPRVGMEVVVDFLEGDPDQPIITGCVYNPVNMPPYVLPDHKTRSVLKTNSSSGGGGFNEFRIEDKKGSEQIFIHGEKDLDIRIKNDCKETILHDRHLIVESEQFEEVRKDKHLKVKYNQNEDIGGTVSQKIGVNQQVKVGNNYAVDAGMGVHIKAGTSAVIEAGASLTLKVGGSFVNIGPAGVYVSGPMIGLNSGGSAGSGAGASPEAPKEPKEAEKGDAGKKVHSPRALPPKPPPYFVSISLSVQAVRIPDNVPSPPAGPPGTAPDPTAAQGSASQARAEAAAVQENNATIPYSAPAGGGQAASHYAPVPVYSEPFEDEPEVSGATPYLIGSAGEGPWIED